MKLSWKTWVILLLLISSLLLLVVLYLIYQRQVLDTIETKVEKFLAHAERRVEIENGQLAEANWIYRINSTDENWDTLQTQLISYSKLIQELQHNLTEQFIIPYTSTSSNTFLTVTRNKVLARKFDIILKHYPASKSSKLSSGKLTHFNQMLKSSNDIWNAELRKIQISVQTTQLNINWSSKIYFDHEKQMALTYWLQFHDEMSAQLKSFLKPYVQLLNENILLNKFTNYKDYVLATEYELNLASSSLSMKGDFENHDVEREGNDEDDLELEFELSRYTSSKEFINEMSDLWYNLKPLYDELHAYVRGEIGRVYNASSLWEDADEQAISDAKMEWQSHSSYSTNLETIPEQFFGFSGSGNKKGWVNLYQLTKPYSISHATDADEELFQKDQGKYSVITLAKMVDDYLTLLGFPAMHHSFWTESVFGNEHGSNCCNTSTFYESSKVEELKIAICGETSEETFKDLVRLMCRVKFQMLQKDEPFWFRQTITHALQRGFEEAIVLAMTRPYQLSKFDLVEGYIADPSSYINYLYKEALVDLPIMIQALATFRWSLEFFNAGNSNNNNNKNILPLEKYNLRWWMLRQNLVGVQPPVSRTKANSASIDFTSILTTNGNPLEDYITIVLKYQIYKSLCIWANESDGSPEDLQTCDISQGGKNNGQRSKLVSILELGSSKSWIEVLKLISNQTQLNTDPMLDYFEPLQGYLEDRNEGRGLQIGWPRLLRSDPLEMRRRS